MADFRLRHYFTDRVSGGFSIPTGFLRFDAGGDAAVQRATGFGDLELQGRYLLKRGMGYSTNIDVEAAMALPTGQSNLSMAQPGATAPPNILSLGRGAFGLRARIGLSKFLTRKIAARGWVGGGSPLSANSNNITFGTLADAGVGATYMLSKSWVLAPQVSGSFMTHSSSSTNGELVNSGGFWLNTELIASWRASDDLSVSLTARLPVYRKVNGEQITETLTGLVQFAYRFGGEDEDEHDHGDGEHDHGDEDGHDHGDAHEGHGDAHEGHGDAHEGHGDAHEGHGDAHAGHNHTPVVQGDVQDAARDGATFDAVAIAVPGKVTIVDFWADWCGPCKPLTKGLEALVAADPKLALRKVEVPNFDTPVAKEHLSNVKGIPVVWIYDAHGKRVHTLVQANLEAVTKAIEATAAAPSQSHSHSH